MTARRQVVTVPPVAGVAGGRVPRVGLPTDIGRGQVFEQGLKEGGELACESFQPPEIGRVYPR